MLKENERFDQLIKENFSIIQNDDVFSFSTDALLLGHFTKPRTKDIVLDSMFRQWGDTLVIVCYIDDI